MSLSTVARGTILALLLQALVCLPVLAEPVPHNTEEIFSLALKHNAELAALEKEATARHLLGVQAGTIANPTLELQGSTGSITGSSEDRSASIGFNQEFPLNGKLGLRREVGQIEAEAIKRQRDNSARLLKDEIATLVIDYSLASRRQELAAELVKLNRELVRIAGERHKAGDIPELELNLANVEIVRAESRLLAAERDKIPPRIKIASLAGLNKSDIDISDVFIAPIVSKKTQELVKRALSSRPDLLALTRECAKAEAETNLAEAEALPNLTAGFFVQWQRSSVEVGGMSSINSDTQVGLRLSMPIPVFDRNQSGRAAARARLDAANSRKVALERTIIAEVETAVSSVSASERLLAMFEQGIIPQLTENLKLVQEAYSLGELGILAVIEEQKKFFEVKDAYLTALHDRQAAFVKLESSVATDLTGGASEE